MLGVGLELSARSSVASFLTGATLDMNFAENAYLGASPAGLTVVRNSAGYAETAQGTLVSFAANEPRITNKGLLVEETRTNIYLQSESFTSSVFTEATGPTQSEVNPTGATSSVVKLTENTANAVHRVVQAVVGVVAGSVNTCTVYLKPAGRTQVVLNWLNDAVTSGGFAVFDLVGDGVAGVPGLSGTGSSFSTSIQRMANGWYRCRITGIVDASSTIGRFRIDTSLGGVNTYLGDGTSGVLMWGAQVEAGSFPTSYIPVTTAAITRAGDQISLTGASFTSWFTSASSLTLYAEGVFEPLDTFAGLATLDLSSDSANNQIQLLRTGAVTLEDKIVAGAVLQKQNGTNSLYGGINKVAYGVATNNTINCVNSTFSALDTVVTVPTVNRLGIGHGAGLSTPTNGYIRRVAYIPSRLSDDALALLTVPAATLDMDFARSVYTGATPADLTVARNSTGYAETLEGTLVLFAANQARITNKGLLVEESRTNLVIRSQEFNTGWSPSPALSNTVTANQVAAPDGTTTADLCVPDTGNSVHLLFITFTGAISTTYTASVYVKPAGYTHVQLDLSNTAFAGVGNGAIFNLTGAGSIFTTGGSQYVAGSAAITALADGWYRISIAATSDADGGAYVVAVRFGPSGTLTTLGALYTGDGVSGGYLWGAQVEAGAFPTSYIPTTTGTVTRASEQVSLLGTAFSSWYTNAAAGTYYVEANSAGAASNAFLSDISDGTTANGIGSYFSVNGTFITHLVNQGGVGQAAPLASGLVAGRTLKTAMAYAANSMQAAYDGALMTVDTSATVPTVNRLTLGRRGDNTFYLNGYIRRAFYIPSRVADSVVASLTLNTPTLSMDFARGVYVGATPSQFNASLRASAGYAQTLEGDWVLFGNNVPRITNRGLLVEEARTNSLRNNTGQGLVAGSPGTLPTNWADVNTAGLTRTIVGTGTENGIDYVDVRYAGTYPGAGSILFYPETITGIAAADASVWTASCFIRLVSGSPSQFASFDFRAQDNVAFTQAAAWTLSSAWNRVSVARTIAAGGGNVWQLFRIVPVAGPVDFTMRIGWPQLELGAFVTSPIRTTSGAVARAADIITLTGTAFSSWFNAAAGTMFADVTMYTPPASGINPCLFSIEDNTANERMQIRRSDNATTPQSTGIILDGGVVQASIASPGVQFMQPGKIAMAYAANSVNQATNGVLGTLDTSATLPTVDRAVIGNGTSASFANSYIRKVNYYPVRLADNVHQSITVP